MTAFSRQNSKKRAIEIKIRRAKLRIRKNPDYKIKYPGEARDSATGKYTLLIKRVTEEAEKQQMKTEKYRSKLHVTI